MWYLRFVSNRTLINYYIYNHFVHIYCQLNNVYVLLICQLIIVVFACHYIWVNIVSWFTAKQLKKQFFLIIHLFLGSLFSFFFTFFFCYKTYVLEIKKQLRLNKLLWESLIVSSVWTFFSVLVDNAKQTKIKFVFLHPQGVLLVLSCGNMKPL